MESNFKNFYHPGSLCTMIDARSEQSYWHIDETHISILPSGIDFFCTAYASW